MSDKNHIEIWTFGNYCVVDDVDYGIAFNVSQKWLSDKVKKMGFLNLKDFLQSYTWDTTLALYDMAKSENALKYLLLYLRRIASIIPFARSFRVFHCFIF